MTERDWTIHPGATLRGWMEDKGYHTAATAAICRMDLAVFRAILEGERELTEEDAVQLASGTGIPARFWVSMERIFRRDLAEGRTWVQ